MKKIILLITTFLSVFGAAAHDITNGCWNASTQKYSFNCTNLPNGNASVKIVDANNNVVTGSGAYSATVNVTGGQITINVPQSVRTTKVRVRFTWSDGYVNLQYSGTNSCSVVALNDYTIQARAVNGNVQAYWSNNDWDAATLQGSSDGNVFKDLITIYNDSVNKVTYNLLTNMMYYRVKFVGSCEHLSNIVKIPDLDYTKPYTLKVYDSMGRLVGSYSNSTQADFTQSGLYYLHYIQQNTSKVIKYYRP